MSVINREISVKNINALFQSVKDLTEKSFEQQKQIDAFQNTVSTVMNEITELKTLIFQHKSKMSGHGATVQ